MEDFTRNCPSLATIFISDNVDDFKELYEKEVASNMLYSAMYGLATINNASKIKSYLISKTLLIKNPETSLSRIADIIESYMEELLGINHAFYIPYLAEESHNNMLTVLLIIQRISNDPLYRYDGDIPSNFFMLIPPLKTFFEKIHKSSDKVEEYYDGISDKYYKRLAKDLLGIDFEFP